MNNKKTSTCELCGKQPAVALCPECCKCYCGECGEIDHEEGSKKGHIKEPIPEGVRVDARCPLHKDNPLEMFCVNEVKLCCATCQKEDTHKGHKIVSTAEVAHDNEMFSASGVRAHYAEILKHNVTLCKKIETIIENIRKEAATAKQKISDAFMKEHEKLVAEESKLMEELEEACNKSEGLLQENFIVLSEVREYSKILNEADSMVQGKCSRLMELNIVSEMEKQCSQVEKLSWTEMQDLKISWNEKARKLSFTKVLFNGAPVPNGIAFPAVMKREVDISWSLNENEVEDCIKSKLGYVVEFKKAGETDDKWRRVYSGKDKKCRVTGLGEGTEYDVRAKCVVGNLQGKWSNIARVKTKKTPSIDSSILSSEGNRVALSDLLGKWCGATGFELLYRGTRDGFGANDFNRTCTNKGKTITLIKNTSGHIFGGFASNSWENSSCGDKRAPGSFLFTLKNMYGIQPTKLPLIDENNSSATHHVTSYGPVFGGHPRDIAITSGCNGKASSWAHFPCSYKDVTGRGKSIFTSNPNSIRFQVQEIEVYKVNP